MQIIFPASKFYKSKKGLQILAGDKQQGLPPNKSGQNSIQVWKCLFQSQNDFLVLESGSMPADSAAQMTDIIQMVAKITITGRLLKAKWLRLVLELISRK